jgi:hypothetical protein
MCLPVGQAIRLQGLAARPALNGCHATVIAAADEEESAELAAKRRVKVVTATTGEILSIALAKAEAVDAQNTLYSTAYFAVVSQTGRGYTWQAKRRIDAGKVLLREEPLLVHRTEDHLVDPLIQSLQEQVEPYLQAQHYPPEAVDLLNQCANRIAERLYARLSVEHRKRYMALSDAFSTPPTKSVGNIYRTNALSRADGVNGGIVYELLSRANHACTPNLGLEFDGFTVIVSTLRSVAAGEELHMSCAPSQCLDPARRSWHHGLLSVGCLAFSRSF